MKTVAYFVASSPSGGSDCLLTSPLLSFPLSTQERKYQAWLVYYVKEQLSNNVQDTQNALFT